MSRTHLVLGGLLLFQVLLIVVFRAPQTSASREAGSRALLPALESSEPARMEIQASGEGGRVTLVRNDDGWSIEAPDGFPADTTRVERLIAELRDLRVGRPVVSSSRYHETFRVTEQDHERRLRVWDSSDELEADVFVGTASNYRATHVRRADEEPVYEVRGLSAPELRTDAAGWIRKELVTFTAEQVVGLELSNASGRIELERREGVWSLLTQAPQDSVVDQERVEELVRSAVAVRLAEPAGTTEAEQEHLADPVATLVLRYMPDGADEPAEVTVRIGATVEERPSQRYVERSGLSYAGTVWESSVKKLIDASVNGLLVT